MDNLYLLDLINEANSRGGGMILNYQDKPAVVVLTVDKYNQLMSGSVNQPAPTDSSARINPNQEEPPPLPRAKPKKVLVTGGAGYIGGHLAYELISNGYEVVILDNLSTGKRENLHPQAVFEEGDLGEVNFLRDVFSANKFEAVFHMAASLEVEESVREPGKYLENNLTNTVKLLSVMNEFEVKKIIFSSTAAVYGETDNNPISETSPVHPNNPYGSSKLLAERAIKFYSEFLGFEAVVFRYFNACGFNSEFKVLPTHSSHLIYKVLQVAKGSQPFLEVYGNDYSTFDGTCIRDYVHVTDIVRPHIVAMESMQGKGKFDIYNIGTGRGYSVAQVVSGVSEVLNKIIPMEITARRPGDAAVTVADNGKLLRELGYELRSSSLENMLSSSWEVLKDL